MIPIRSRDAQRAKLLADGVKALELIERGRSIVDILMVIPGSRARLYRAMALASPPGQAYSRLPAQETRDPLLD